MEDWAERGEIVIASLQATAEHSQAGLVALLESRRIPHEAFWISNTVRVTGTADLAVELAARPEVEQVQAEQTYQLPPTRPAPAIEAAAVEWNVERVRAPEVWSTFATRGEGIVVANIDTGVEFDHPALASRYRGAADGPVDHDHNWFDPSRACGDPSLGPCDNQGHGTHHGNHGRRRRRPQPHRRGSRIPEHAVAPVALVDAVLAALGV